MDVPTGKLLLEMGISLRDPAPGLAARIETPRELKAFLLCTPLAKRKEAYNALRPHLKFNVMSYTMLMGGERTRKASGKTKDAVRAAHTLRAPTKTNLLLD